MVSNFDVSFIFSVSVVHAYSMSYEELFLECRLVLSSLLLLLSFIFD
jgi:hypothetical protein